ncbi:unnamed protein product [Owenia fusiformis]|uniref:Uncharacterized protein n=1 Tax=Owenia fusiformis TaxID=6347 RepID=A0A8J1XZ32_OWEFU|nr:unnamed protein product [Owenia fusiformis]
MHKLPGGKMDSSFLIFSLIILKLSMIESSGSQCSTGKCCHADYLLVRDNTFDWIYETEAYEPSCPLIVSLQFSTQNVGTLESCFAKACALNANVVTYGHLRSCKIFKCESNSNQNDWDYKFKYSGKSGYERTYAKPHSYSPGCNNSHFVRRTWMMGHTNVASKCSLTRPRSVVDVAACMKAACDDKANVFNFYPGEEPQALCETRYCRFDKSRNDYDFEIEEITTSGNKTVVYIYSLSHTQKSWRTKYDQIPTSLSNFDFCTQVEFIPHPSSEISETPEHFCDFRSNLLITFPNGSIQTWNCGGHLENIDTGNVGCYADENKQMATMTFLPYPGTPNCGDSIFMLRRFHTECTMSMCDTFLEVPEAKDLRQCMLYACQHGANVINFMAISNNYSSGIICDLRFCGKLPNGDYDFKFQTSNSSLRFPYAVFALQSDPGATTNAQVDQQPDCETVLRALAITVTVIGTLLLVCIIVVIATCLKLRKSAENPSKDEPKCVNLSAIFNKKPENIYQN